MGTEQPTQNDGNSGAESEPINVLRQKLKDAETAAANAEQLRRENALLRNGIDVSSPLTELFVDGYKGEWTPDAVAEAAEKYGLPKAGVKQEIQEQANQQQQQQRQQDQEAFGRLGEAAAGSERAPATNVDYSSAKTPQELAQMVREAGGQIVDEWH